MDPMGQVVDVSWRFVERGSGFAGRLFDASNERVGHLADTAWNQCMKPTDMRQIWDHMRLLRPLWNQFGNNISNHIKPICQFASNVNSLLSEGVVVPRDALVHSLQVLSCSQTTSTWPQAWTLSKRIQKMGYVVLHFSLKFAIYFAIMCVIFWSLNKFRMFRYKYNTSIYTSVL